MESSDAQIEVGTGRSDGWKRFVSDRFPIRRLALRLVSELDIVTTAAQNIIKEATRHSFRHDLCGRDYFPGRSRKPRCFCRTFDAASGVLKSILKMRFGRPTQKRKRTGKRHCGLEWNCFCHRRIYFSRFRHWQPGTTKRSRRRPGGAGCGDWFGGDRLRSRRRVALRRLQPG